MPATPPHPEAICNRFRPLLPGRGEGGVGRRLHFASPLWGEAGAQRRVRGATRETTRRTRMTATPTLPKYVHLKVHSAYSLLEGALPIGKIAKLAEAAGMPAIGLTDTNNLFGALEFSE